MNERGKNPLASKTLIFNTLAVIVAVAIHYGYRDFDPTPDIPAFARVIVLIGGPLVNIVLRLVTKEPLRILPKWE